MKLGFLVEGSGTKHLRELDANNRVNAKVEIHTFLFVRKPFQSQEDYEMRNDVGGGGAWPASSLCPCCHVNKAE
jgi:hypothetical protein